MTHRLPRRLHLGKGYTVEIVLASQAVLREVCEAEDHEHLDGVWDSLLGDGGKVAGRIYVYDKLPLSQKWETYWHELAHAVTDISAWDRESQLKT